MYHHIAKPSSKEGCINQSMIKQLNKGINIFMERRTVREYLGDAAAKKIDII